ncbi:MAG: hypothetical protein MUF51_03825, partial [Vicinamibacteria bacterium]|nr:hypothetical protein [Vicinamibacteria bacterium]
MAEARVANPLVEQFYKGRVPRELRLMAAQGALPLKTADLSELLLYLRTDPDEEISQTAAQSLIALPAQEVLALAHDRGTVPAVLAWILADRSEHELRAATLQNTSTEDEAIEILVADLPAELAELVVINQVRLLRRHSLLVALEGNLHLNNDQRRRLRELRETFHIGAEQAAAAAPAP